MRYRAFSDECDPSITAETVIDIESPPVRTGLLDADGRPIWRLPERVPIGFLPPAKPARA